MEPRSLSQKRRLALQQKDEKERYHIEIVLEGKATRAAFETIRQMAMTLIAVAGEEFDAGVSTQLKVLFLDRQPDAPGPR